MRSMAMWVMDRMPPKRALQMGHERVGIGAHRERHCVQLFSKSEFQKIFRIFFSSFLWVFCVWFTLLLECMFSKHVTEIIKVKDKSVTLHRKIKV